MITVREAESIIRAMNDQVAELRRNHPGVDIPSRQSVRYAARQLLKDNHGPINAVLGKIVLVMQDRDLGRPVRPHRSGAIP